MEWAVVSCLLASSLVSLGIVLRNCCCVTTGRPLVLADWKGKGKGKGIITIA